MFTLEYNEPRFFEDSHESLDADPTTAEGDLRAGMLLGVDNPPVHVLGIPSDSYTIPNREMGWETILTLPKRESGGSRHNKRRLSWFDQVSVRPKLQHDLTMTCIGIAAVDLPALLFTAGFGAMGHSPWCQSLKGSRGHGTQQLNDVSAGGRTAEQITDLLVPATANLLALQRRQRVRSASTDLVRRRSQGGHGVMHQQALIEDQLHHDVVERLSGRCVLILQQAPKWVRFSIYQMPFDFEQTIRALKEAQIDLSMMNFLASDVVVHLDNPCDPF